MGLTAAQRSLLFRYDRDLPLRAETVAVVDENNLHVEQFTFASIHGQRVPAVLYRPAGEMTHLPVVVAGHGAGAGKDDPLMRGLFEHWAREGLACLCIDAPYHGERVERIADPIRLLNQPFTGMHFAVQTVVDNMRLIDWAETRPELDTSRLGYAGFSMGTILGVQFVAMEQRVRAAVFAIGGAGLLHYLAGQAPAAARHDYDMVAEAFDPMHYAPLIAPRPVLMVNGLQDQVIPAALGHVLFNSLREPRKIIWYDGGHGEIPRQHIHDMRSFLMEHLRPAEAIAQAGSLRGSTAEGEKR